MGSIFYFDSNLYHFENNYDWDRALSYLEDIFINNKLITQVYSLIGFSWYYIIEGPCESKKYDSDICETGLIIWRKYIDWGIRYLLDDAYFNFIAGYTLSLHGFLLDSYYEKLGAILMKKCKACTKQASLLAIANNFLQNANSNKIIKLMNGKEICKELFNGESILERYFCEIYGKE